MTHRISVVSAVICVSFIALAGQNIASGQDRSSTVSDSRDAQNKNQVLTTGSQTDVQTAVDLAYSWLVKQQQADGSWSLVGPYGNGGQTENRVAATAISLLALISSGMTHQVGDYHDSVSRGLDWLVDQQDEKGYFFYRSRVPSHHRAYAQAFASLVICELYSRTKNETLRPAAQLAIQCAEAWQSPEGGWRYAAQQGSDTSVTGWYMLLLHSGNRAGLEVKPESLNKVTGYLDSVQSNEGAAYAYLPGRPASYTPTAEGLLIRQLLGWKNDHPALIKGIDAIGKPVKSKEFKTDVYGWYFATLAMERFGKEARSRWTSQLRDSLLPLQVTEPIELGSWSPESDDWGREGGRLVITCFAIAELAAYYRHLPLYQVESAAK